METDNCDKPGCKNRTISYSQFCGKHSDVREIKRKLKMHTDQCHTLELSDIHLKRLKFKDRIVFGAELSSCDFSFTVFENCEINQAHVIHGTFDLCRFVGCEFWELDANDVTFMNCAFDSCTFKESDLSQSSFDGSNFGNCNFTNTSFNGHLFIDIECFNFCQFDHCHFLQTSFSRVNMLSTNFKNSTLIKSSLHDSRFLGCAFEDSTNDFRQTGPPMLCHFNDTLFTNFYLPRSSTRWNNFNLRPSVFYRRVVRMILGINESSENYLSELTLALTHLEKLNYKPSGVFNFNINEFFSRLIKENARNANYEQAGEVINEYGKVPERYRTKSSFILPPPDQDKPAILKYQARLTLKVQLDEWQLQRVSRLFSQLAALEQQIPGPNSQVLSRLEHGSFISVFWGDIKQLLYTGRLLDVEKLEISITKDEADVQKTHLEIKRQKIELDTIQEDRALDQTIKRQNIESQRLNIISQKLDLLERLEKRHGIDPIAYAKTPEGQAAAEIAAEINKEFPIISVRIDEDGVD